MALSGSLLAVLIFRDAPRYGMGECAGWLAAWALLAMAGLLRARIVGLPIDDAAWYASAAYLGTILVTFGRPAVLIPVWADYVAPGRDYGAFTRIERRIQAIGPWLVIALVIAVVLPAL